jgi:hypothetical protein
MARTVMAECLKKSCSALVLTQHLRRFFQRMRSYHTAARSSRHRGVVYGSLVLQGFMGTDRESRWRSAAFVAGLLSLVPSQYPIFHARRRV